MNLEGATPNATDGAVVLNGRYRLQERMSDSAYFLHFRAYDEEDGRDVAVRVLKPEYAADDAFIQRLLSGSLAAAKLRHPNILQVLDVWKERGTVLVATEWVRATTLRDRLKRTSLFPPAVGADIATGVAAALHYLHESDFIHGALSPETIQVSHDGHVRLTDIGLGSAIAVASRVQMAFLGELAPYLAPERAGGGAPTASADQYAVGCVLYEMIAGRPAFSGENPLAVAVRHVQDEPPAPRAKNPNVPQALDALVLRTLQKATTARYESTSKLLEELQRIRTALRRGETPESPNADRRTGAPEQDGMPPRTTKRMPTRSIDSEPPRARRSASPPPPPPREDSGPSWKLLMSLAGLILLLLGGSFAAGVLLTRTPTEITVPSDLIGKTQEEATAALQKLEILVESRREFSDTFGEGQVFRTDPRGGIQIRAGKTVTLLVSKGPEPITVPNVVSKDFDQAKRELEAAGFILGAPKTEYNDFILKRQVIGQNPLGDTLANRKTPVILTISNGPEPAPPAQPVDVEPAPEPAAPAPDTSTLPTDPSEGEREQIVEVLIPQSRRGDQHVRIDVVDADGATRTAAEATYQPGDTVRQSVKVRGPVGKCTIKVFINGRLQRSESV